jgi:hydrogenase small subunit
LKSVKEVLEDSKIDVPFINIPGCPPHPDWFEGTLVDLLMGEREVEIDKLSRPQTFFRKLIHEGCPRRTQFDKGLFAKNFGDEGCLYELGCKGPFTSADCPEREFNGGINWCIKNGSPCHGCVEPEFTSKLSPMYGKVFVPK